MTALIAERSSSRRPPGQEALPDEESVAEGAKAGVAFGEAAEALFALTGPTALSAGAGSGKTTCLVELCMRLMSGEATGSPLEPSEIAAITFTEKAAAELEDRLRAEVAERARCGGKEEGRAWRSRLHGLERMAVGTIHGFARQLLREHALEAGLDPDRSVIDEEAANALRREAARSALLAALDRGSDEARVLCAAYGAGGKRTGLIEAVSDIVRERATLGESSPMRPKADEEEAALAARRQVFGALGALLAAPKVPKASGPSARARLAEAAGCLEGWQGPLRPETLRRVSGLARALRSLRGGGAEERDQRRALLEDCEHLALRIAEALAGPQKAELCRLVADTEHRYGELKQAQGVLDFDDLLSSALHLLGSQHQVRAELRGRLRALLVDEYQDVNPVQHAIFELLTREEQGLRGPVLVAVGDLKQSIYRFRGADVAVFNGLQRRLETEPAGRVLHLSTNYRSRPALLDLVNEVFARCMQPEGPRARPYELAFGPADRLVPVRAGSPGAACEVLEDQGGEDGEERRRREARAIAARIKALVSGEAGLEVSERPTGLGREEGHRRPRFGDIGLLFRRLTQVAPYEHALRQAGIPYRLARGGGFYQAAEVRDLGELLATLSDPRDALAWAAVLRSPMCGLSDGGLFAVSRVGFEALARRAPEDVLSSVLALYPALEHPWPSPDLPSTEATRLVRFLGEWQALSSLKGRLSAPDLLHRAVERLDLEAAHLASPDGERRAGNLRKALLLAERFTDGGGSLKALVERLRTMALRPPSEPEAELEVGDAVALLSVHQAKGLEWPVVFLPDLGAVSPVDTRRALRGPDGELVASYYDVEADLHHLTSGLAAAREEMRRAGAAESRRLLYVALTRARDRIVLSGEARRGVSWRSHLEGALEARPDLAVRVPCTAPAKGELEGESTGRGRADERKGGLEAPLLSRNASPSAVRIAVTDLAEYLRCPRRLYLARELMLPERPMAHRSPEDDPERATARGTLAHAMLAQTDLAAPPLEWRVQLAAAAARLGYDPGQALVRRIMADLTRFLATAPGERLAAAARAGILRREVPFLLKLEAQGSGPCYLTGVLDALVDDGHRLDVLDFKYALGRPGTELRYRVQLLAYVLAATRARPGRRVTASIQYLRGGCACFDLTPSASEIREFASSAPRLAAEAASGLARVALPQGLGRSLPGCRAEACGYVPFCYRRAGS